MIELDDIIGEFIVESSESLDTVDQKLIELEQSPGDNAILAGIFRSIHSIKGTCGFLGFDTLGNVAHVGENLLSKLRDGELAVTEEITSSLLSLVDAIRSMLGEIEKTGKDCTGDYSNLVAELNRLQASEPSQEVATAPAIPPAVVPVVQSSPAFEPPTPAVVENATAASLAPSVSATAASPIAASPVASAPVSTPVTVAPIPEPPKKEVVAGNSGESKAPQAAENNVRVDVGLLDSLMNLVGELVLARNQMLQFSSSIENSAFQSTSQRLNHITSELQEKVMKTRMQPVGSVWSKFPRIVRDLSMSINKQVRVEMVGAETELDKTIIEAIKDPLTHIIRNSVDHGIESPDVRVARGKSPEGLLSLKAFHENGQVVIEVTDDGGGIDGKRVKAKAVEKQLITQEQSDRMSDRDAIHLIFLPGFSTAEKVSSISGRGVGMDVVKTNIEKIGGNVDIQSEVGSGSCIRIRIPLTLAIIPALTVGCAGHRFAIPQISLLELLHIDPNKQSNKIEWINDTPVYRLRGDLLPLVCLGKELKLKSISEIFSSGVHIVVLQANDRQFGLVVDDIQDTGEIVVKPLSKCIKNATTYAGATILGDGTVALILDVIDLASRANVVTQVAQNESLSQTNEESESSNLETLLLFTTSNDSCCAVPISSLARLEEVQRDKLELVSGQLAMQYRDQILPVLDLNMALSYAAAGQPVVSQNSDDEVVHMLVYGDDDQALGLVVDEIADIVEADLSVRRPSARPGVAYTAIVHGKIIEVLDIEQIIEQEQRAGRASLSGFTNAK